MQAHSNFEIKGLVYPQTQHLPQWPVSTQAQRCRCDLGELGTGATNPPRWHRAMSSCLEIYMEHSPPVWLTTQKALGGEKWRGKSNYVSLKGSASHLWTEPGTINTSKMGLMDCLRFGAVKYN